MPRLLKFFIVSVCLLNICTLSAQVRQVGRIVEINSNGKAVSGVSVEAVSSDDVQPAVSDSGGIFVLNFAKKKRGDVVYNLRVYKSGYEVVNSQLIKDGVVLTEKDTLKIVVAPPARLAEARANYYEIFDNYQIGVYKKQIEELKSQLAKNEIPLAEYEQRAVKAEEDLKNANSKIAEYADRFSRINKDDMDSVGRRAFAALDNGDIEGALNVYSNYNSLERLSRKIDQRNEADASIKELIPGMKEEIELRLLVGGKENRRIVGQMYEKIIEADSTNDYVLAQAVRFFSDEVNIEKVMKYGMVAERNCRSKIHMSYIYLNMGRMAIRTKDLDTGRGFFEKAIKTAEDGLGAEVSDSYFYVLINYPIHELGAMYYENCEYEKAEKVVKKSVEIRRKLYESDDKFSGEYANSLSSLSIILSDRGKNDSAMACIDKAIEIETRIMPQNPRKYAPRIADFNTKKGNIYMELKNYQGAKAAFVDAVRIMEAYEFVNYEADVYLYALYRLAKAEVFLKEDDEASATYEKLLDLCVKYGGDNGCYEEIYASTNETYGDVFFSRKDYIGAFEHYSKGMEIYEKSADRLRIYKFHLINCYVRMGKVCLALGDMEKGEQYTLEAYNIAKAFYDENNEIYRGTYKTACAHVANFYRKIGKKRTAKRYERIGETVNR